LQGTDLPEHKADNHEDNLSSDETKDGNWARIFVNVLQSFQFFLNVSLLTVTNGQGLAQGKKGVAGYGSARTQSR
jgi:hypothetical protein